MIVYVVITTIGIWNDFDKFEVFSTEEAAIDYMKESEQKSDSNCYLYVKEVL